MELDSQKVWSNLDYTHLLNLLEALHYDSLFGLIAKDEFPFVSIVFIFLALANALSTIGMFFITLLNIRNNL